MKEYLNALKKVLFLNSQVMHLVYDVENGVQKKEDILPLLSLELEHSKEVLIKEKEELNFAGELAFLEDSNFIGFSIQNGNLTGSIDAALTWALSVLDKDIRSNTFYFEVASFIISLVAFFNERSEL